MFNLKLLLILNKKTNLLFQIYKGEMGHDTKSMSTPAGLEPARENPKR